MTMRLRTLLPTLAFSLGILAADPAISLSATITIVNLDGGGEGFNDPTPAAPVVTLVTLLKPRPWPSSWSTTASRSMAPPSLWSKP